MKPVIRCSQLDQLFACPASRLMIPRVSSRDSDESLEGTMLHWLTAAELVSHHGATPPPGGLPPPRVPESYNLPEQSRWIYEFFIREASEIPGDWAMEVEVPLAYEFERFILTGHPDLLAVNTAATESWAKDWKCGYRAVDPADINNQALGYIVLQKRAWPTLQRARFDIVQPRANEDEGEQRVSTVEVAGDELEQAVAYLEKQVNAALDNAAQINSGPRQCRWCPVGIQCPAIQAEIEDMKAKLTPEALAAIRKEPNDALLGDIYVQVRTIKGAVEDAESMLHERLDKNKLLQAGCGLTITQHFEGGQYTCKDPGAAFAAARSELPEHELAKVVSYSVTRLKGAIARVRDIPKTGKAAVTAEGVFADKFAAHFEQGERRIVKIS